MPLRLSLKTKFTLTTSLLVLAVVALIASLYVATLTRQVIRDTNDRARFVTQQVFMQVRNAVQDASDQGSAPASASPEDVRQWVRQTLDEDASLSALIESTVGYSPTIYEVSVADGNGVALVSSDASLPGLVLPQHAPFDTLANSNFLGQLQVLYGPPRVFEVRLPFDLGGQPFGEIRVGLSTALMRSTIDPDMRRALWLSLAAILMSTMLAAVASHMALAPLTRISAQLDRISRGETEVEPIAATDEFGQVSTKITQIGQQLRGVREIFSTLRENLNQIMSGLEDGLLLFSRDGRAVLASPSLENFLGLKPDALLGRRAEEIFPPDHPLREALHLESGRLEETLGAEVNLEGAGGGTAGRPRLVSVNVQVIEEGGTRMGALVLLRDLESLERIGSQLQVSERLAAIGRVTAGVAHEVKNPLNSMRLWLENLRESLPADQELPQQAVKILDGEIDRLDRVVKTFLDFSRPVELHLEEAPLAEVLEEIMAVARPQVEQAGVEARLEVHDGAAIVRVDRQLLKQAILNLVLNACEVMRAQDDARLRKLTFTLTRNEQMAELRVADTGPGISPENRRKIFQLFFTTRTGGSGIGLATTFRIVQMHNGSIDFDTEVGRGTTFRIELPLAH
jgi:PAS domain S-box-containing protein